MKTFVSTFSANSRRPRQHANRCSRIVSFAFRRLPAPVAPGPHCPEGAAISLGPQKNVLKAVTANLFAFHEEVALWNCDCIEALAVAASNDRESFRKRRSNQCPQLSAVQSLPCRCSLQESMHTLRRNVVWFGMNRSTRAKSSSSFTKLAGSNNSDCGALFCGHTTR